MIRGPKERIDAFRKLCAEWADCTSCGISQFRTKMVQGRGSLPCDFVLLGEAPGKAEDLLGEPFVGPAGKLLNTALDQFSGRYALFICNLLACRPTDSMGGPNRAPTDIEVRLCWKRLDSLLKLAAPRFGLILLGRNPEKHRHAYAGTFPELPMVYVQHPAAVLRHGGTAGPEFPEYVRQLEAAFNSCLTVKGGKSR